MPTYQYLCANGHHFEHRQKMSSRPIHKCPECGASAERQISGGSGLIFKGSGFYITDYGKDGKGPRKPESAGAGEAAPATPAPSPASPGTTPAVAPSSGETG